jgi:outer membrane protein assembly factor BamB
VALPDSPVVVRPYPWSVERLSFAAGTAAVGLLAGAACLPGARRAALDGAAGDERWHFDAGAPISGSATVIDGVVRFATLRGRTYALQARDGRLLWTFPDGRYAPAVGDGRRLYLTGYATVYGLSPAGG